MKQSIIKYCLILGLGLTFTSCGVGKFIPEGEKLYTGASLDLNAEKGVDSPKRLEEELDEVVRPNPNSKFLGMRVGLWAHFKGSQEKPGFINRFLKKKIGQEPVYFSQVDISGTEELLLNRLENNGYFYGQVLSSVDTKGKFAGVNYEVSYGEPYRLANYQFLGDSLPIQKEIQKMMGETELLPGERFSLSSLKSERGRLDEGLKQKGFYNFNSEFLIFEADTNQHEKRQIDLYLRLKENLQPKAFQLYRIDQISVYPNYMIDQEAFDQDTVILGGIDYIQDETMFKPHLLKHYILLEEGMTYNSKLARLTRNRLSSIGIYRYVSLKFNEKDSVALGETGRLDANIYLSPLKKRSVRAELQGVSKSNNFLGPALMLTYRNRNLFKGGETLNISGEFSFETQIAGGDRTGLSSYELGLNTSLIFPRVIFPIPINERFNYAIPKTKISLGAEYLDRVHLYRLNSLTATYGYYWNANRYVYHEINPISLSIVNLSNTSSEFEEILNENPFLRRSFDQQFLAGLNYTFNYNQLVDQEKVHKIFVGTTLDMAGNILGLLEGGGASEEPGTFLGLEYAQYAKGELDFRYHMKISEQQTLAARLFGGVGIPYGNSISLPFVKQFFTGGPNSVRAFRIRSLGPGTYMPESVDNQSYFEQSGDIRLEGNLEYRFPLVSFLKGALFMDAGNVWLKNENEALPGGKFSSSWFKELGVGAGLGLRVDIEFFVIRFDLATPLKKPYLPEGERWDNSFELGDKEWRRDNLIFNFAIGYPF
ncbi:BamA/TamA family outer membrane protein [Echinicola jeungdonensis]|uniref:BamA/TamA family outer membrane protein n=1 Tax=Echinicola jeungdonensis TaxID=709343 RepID=A0ABV5J2H7_9BACT|nr:BamA/TamA family outer membrane protein [Echinicola jeungdonensis]MDN3670132.1 BamA/TamA family outer membrane protein [Echinicola jeungdonensis]